MHQTITVRWLSLIRHNGTGGAALSLNWPNSVPAATSPTRLAADSPPWSKTFTSARPVAHAEPVPGPGILLSNAAAAKIATFNIQGGGTNGDSGVELHGIPNGLGVPGRSVGAAIHDGTVNGFTRGVRAISTLPRSSTCRIW